LHFGLKGDEEVAVIGHLEEPTELAVRELVNFQQLKLWRLFAIERKPQKWR